MSCPGHTNPTATLKHHLRTNQPNHNSPIFSIASPQNSMHLTKHCFMQRCNAIWRKAGYPRVTRHSFRIGGTTELLLAGVPPDVVKKAGRWSSDSFLRYWRSAEDIIHVHSHIRPQAEPSRPHKRARTHY